MPDYNVQVIVPGSQATTVELPGIAGPPGPQGPVGPAGIPNTGALDLRYVTLSGNQTISGSKRFIQDDIIYTSSTFTDPYTNLIVDYSYINNLILKPIPEYRPVVSPNPNYLYTGIDGGTESQMYFDTGASRWKFYYGGLNPIHLVAQSPIVKAGDPITFAARLPMNGWINSIGNQDTDFKLHYTTIHKSSHQIGGKDYLDPDTINAVAKTGNQIISGIKTFASRPTVNGTGVLLSGEATVLPNTIVYTTGNQIISGIKTFASRPTVNGTGVLLSGEAAALPNTIVYITGDQTISGIKNFNDGLRISNNPLFYSQPSGSYIEDPEPTYDGGYFLGSTKLSQKTSRLVDSSFGSVWVAKDSSRAWYSISISSNGQYQTASVADGQIYVSSDYGNSWAARMTDYNRLWLAVSISSDGKYQSAAAFGDSIYVSSDYGRTWGAAGNTVGLGWNGGISISSDGKYQVASTSGGLIFGSNNYGKTWTLKFSRSATPFIGVSINSNGKYQSAVVQNGQIYISSDYGATWTAKDSDRNWYNISMSSDGKYQTAVIYGGQIYVSTDYGDNWTAKDSDRYWASIDMSSDGKYQTSVSLNQIYVSINYGNTWTFKGDVGGANVVGISISSDGKYQSLAGYNGQIYVSKTDELIDGSLYVNNLYAKNTLTLDSIDPNNYFDQPRIILADAGLLKGSGPQASIEYRSISLGANITDSGNGADLKKVYDGTASPILNLAAGPETYAGRNGIYFMNNTSSSSQNQFDNLMFIDMEKDSSTYGAVRIGNFQQTDRTVPTTEVGYTLQVDGNIKAFGTGDFNGLDLNNVDNLTISGIDIYIENGNVSLTNTPTVRGNPVLTGVDLTQYATISNLNLTGANLNNKINTLSGVSVLTYGAQNIYGNKTFYDNISINNLTVTGTQTIANVINTNIESNYLLLNITGGAIAGGIFFITGTQGSGLGPIMGYDLNNNKFKIGTGSRNGGITTLDTIATENFVNTNAVLISGNQSIAGNKTLTSKLNITVSASNDSALKVGTLEFQPYSVNNAWLGDNTYYNAGFYRREEGYAGAFYFQGPEGQFRFADTDDAGTTYTPAVQLKTHLDGRFGVGSNISTATDDFTNSNLFVDSTDNGSFVGLGTTTPAEKLHVAGNLKLDGSHIYIYDSANDANNNIYWFDSELMFNNIYDHPNPSIVGFLFNAGPLGENVLYSNRPAAAGAYLTIPSGRNGYIAINSDLVATGSILNNKINTLSGSLPRTIVYTTGNQTISGIKTFAGGANQILNTTYSNLTGLKATNNLLSGQLYRISDFVLKWNNQSINDQTVKTAASGEPLIVTALSNNKIYHIAQSEIYPQDTIYYDINAIGSYSWGTINNTAAISGFKGWIYRRVDNLLNIDIPYDWRNITANCCRPDVSSVPNYFPNVQYSRLDCVKETGNNNSRGKLYYSITTGNIGNVLNNVNYWGEVSSFVESGTYFSTNEIDNFTALSFYDVGNEEYIYKINVPYDTNSRIQQPTFTSTLTGLGTFKIEDVYNIKINGGYNNVIEYYAFNNNTIGDNFSNNTIRNLFRRNTIGNYFTNNIIGALFESNTIKNNFAQNSIGQYCLFNTIENNFSSNIIVTSFQNNVIENFITSNIIGGNFNNNNIKLAFFSNAIENNFQYNNIGSNFQYNSIGNNFQVNTIGYGFYSNIIGNNFFGNISEDNFTGANFLTSTHVYNSSYNKTLFKNSAGTQRLRYFNSSDQLVVTDPTA